MHVLVVTQYFWPENFRINDLVNGLVERGHKVTVLTGMPNYPEGRLFRGYSLFGRWSEEYQGAKVVRVPLIARGKGGGARLGMNYLSFVVSSCLLGPIRCREEYDVIFIFEPSPVTVALPALLMKLFYKIPVIFWVQDLWPESLTAAGAVTSPKVLHIVGSLVRFIYRRCDYILVTSKAYVPSVQQYLEDSNRIHYFPQYSEEIYRPVALSPDAPERSLVPPGFVVMFAGNIGEAQDFGTILAAAALLRDHEHIQFVVVGDGRMRTWVEEEVKKLELHRTFHLLGRYPLEKMPALFSLADVMLVTLKKDPIFSLTVPAKIQSYLACRKPIIAALDGEGARIIEEASAGATCSAENPQELAASILRMSILPHQDLKEMGNNGLHYYNKNFDRATLLDQLEKLMKELTEREKRVMT